MTDVAGATVTLTDIESGAITKLTDVETLSFASGTSYSLAELQNLFATARSVRGEQSVRLQDKLGPFALPKIFWVGGSTVILSDRRKSRTLDDADRDGQSVLILKDLGNDGTVDQIGLVSQNAAQLLGGTIDSKKTILAGESRDNHVRNSVYEGAASASLAQALDALNADAADGTINDEAAYQRGSSEFRVGYRA